MNGGTEEQEYDKRRQRVPYFLKQLDPDTPLDELAEEYQRWQAYSEEEQQ